MQSSILYQDPQVTLTRAADASATVSTASDKRAELSRRSHDIKNAIQSLHLVHNSLLQGYRFDDALAPQKLEYLGKIIGTVEKESQLLLAIFLL